MPSNIHDLLAQRRSGRAYDTSRGVDLAMIMQLIEAARWSPSCSNEQPWQFLFCEKHLHPDSWSRVYECLAAGNQVWVKSVPLLVVALATKNFTKGDSPNAWHAYDTGAASLSLCLQATAMGLMAHQMGGYNSEQLTQQLQIPDSMICMAVIAVGYPLDEKDIPEQLRAREMAPRQRKEYHENFHLGKIGEGFNDR